MRMAERHEATVVTSASEARRLGDYLLVGEIAEGGMGRIYLARKRGPGGFEKLVAVKVMHPNLAARGGGLIEMFMDEARIASRIGHPNVCGVFDYGEAQGVRYLVMEYLAGQPLMEVNKSLEGLPAVRGDRMFYSVVARVVAEACEGLHGAHSATDEEGSPLGVVHRDVSPENIFVTYDGAVKLMDFGIARATGRMHETVAGTFKGKIAYASPEAFNTGANDPRSDVWSVGVVLWELLTGRACFLRDTEAATLGAILRDPIHAPSAVRRGVPAELDRITLRALEREPPKRFPSAREMARELNRFAVRSGEHVGTAEIAAWMQRIFPAEKQRALETYRAVHSIDSSWDRAPALDGDQVRKALVSQVVERPSGESEAPDWVDPDEPTRLAGANPPPPGNRGLHLEPTQIGESPWSAPNEYRPRVRPARSPSSSRGRGGRTPIDSYPGEADDTEEDSAFERSGGRTLVLRIAVGLLAVVAGVVIAQVFVTKPPSGARMPPGGSPVSQAVPPRAPGVRPGPPAGSPESQAVPPPAPVPPTNPAAPSPPTPATPGVPTNVAPAQTAVPPAPTGEPAPAAAAPEPRRAPSRSTAGLRALRAERAARRRAAREAAARRREARRAARRAPTATPESSLRSGDPGVVNVFAVGGWADIFEGSRRLGRTPARLSLTPGRHTLTLKPPQGPERRRVVRVPAGGEIRMRVEL